MGNEGPGSGDGLLALFGLALGAMHVVRLYRYLRTRVIRPGAADPARLLKSLLYGVPLLAVAVFMANVAMFDVWGLDAVITVIVLDVVALFGLPWLAAVLWVAAEEQRAFTGYEISEHSYPDAPRQVTNAMRRIHNSARTVSHGRANAEGMFGDLQVHQLVYEAAQQAVMSSELSEAVRDLKSSQTSEDRDALDSASTQLDEILQYLVEVEASLKRAAGIVNRLSDNISRPERERAAVKRAEEAAAAKARRREQARAQLDEAATRAAARPSVGPNDIEDRVSAVHAGYEEASRVSDAVLEVRPVTAPKPTRTPAGDDADDDRRRAAREAVWKATRTSAGKAGKFSVTAARLGAEKIRNRNKEQ
jgi:hypothetical protein